MRQYEREKITRLKNQEDTEEKIYIREKLGESIETRKLKKDKFDQRTEE